jgi:hypothetical protein
MEIQKKNKPPPSFFTFEADQNKKQKTECSPQHEAWLVQHRLHLLVSRNMKDSQVGNSDIRTDQIPTKTGFLMLVMFNTGKGFSHAALG